MSITLRQLEVFVAVSEEGSLTRAGESLGLPQSSISTQLKELEGLLGLSSLIVTRACQPDRGRHAVCRWRANTGRSGGHARRLSAAQDAGEGAGFDCGFFHAGGSGASRMVKFFSEMHPGIKIELLDVTQDDVIQMVKGGAVDFGGYGLW
jgi:DNA-binding transcriptional LysR family regulator